MSARYEARVFFETEREVDEEYLMRLLIRAVEEWSDCADVTLCENREGVISITNMSGQ